MMNLTFLGLYCPFSAALAASWDGKQLGETMEKLQPGATSKKQSCFPRLTLSNL